MRLLLKSDSWYFAISNKLAKQRYSELKLFPFPKGRNRERERETKERERPKRERDQREKELKRRGASREKREVGFDRAKNRQTHSEGKTIENKKRPK